MFIVLVVNVCQSSKTQWLRAGYWYVLNESPPINEKQSIQKTNFYQNFLQKTKSFEF